MMANGRSVHKDQRVGSIPTGLSNLSVDIRTKIGYHISMKNKNTNNKALAGLFDLCDRAKQNALERLDLINEMRDVVKEFKLNQKVDDIDGNLLRKLNRFPGDITTHRIATVCKKLVDGILYDN